MSLLSCKNCGGPVEVYGKHGAVLHTNCESCGYNSMSLIQAYEKKQAEFARGEQEIEVIRHRKKHHFPSFSP